MMDITLEGTLSGHQNPIYTIACDEDRGVLFTAGNDKGVVEWDVDQLNFRRVLCQVPSSVYTLHKIPHTALLAIGLRSGDIYIVDVDRQLLIAKLKVDSGAVFHITSLSKKQELIAIGEEGKAYVWRLESFEFLYSFKISNTTVRVIAIDEDEQYLTFGDKNGFIHLVSANDYHTLTSRQVHDSAITSLCFFEGILLSGGRDAKLYKSAIPDLVLQAQITPHMFTVYAISKLGQSPYFATVSRDKTLKIWDKELKLHKNISRDRDVDSHYLSINSQVYLADRSILATAGDDKVIKIWKINL